MLASMLDFLFARCCCDWLNKAGVGIDFLFFRFFQNCSAGSSRVFQMLCSMHVVIKKRGKWSVDQQQQNGKIFNSVSLVNERHTLNRVGNFLIKSWRTRNGGKKKKAPEIRANIFYLMDTIRNKLAAKVWWMIKFSSVGWDRLSLFGFLVLSPLATLSSFSPCDWKTRRAVTRTHLHACTRVSSQTISEWWIWKWRQ